MEYIFGYFVQKRMGKTYDKSREIPYVPLIETILICPRALLELTLRISVSEDFRVEKTLLLKCDARNLENEDSLTVPSDHDGEQKIWM